MLIEPLETGAARRLIRNILDKGSVTFSSHALDEMEKDGLTKVDAAHVLRAGLVQFSENVHGTWRYRVAARKMTFVIAFLTESELKVVTAWRKK